MDITRRDFLKYGAATIVVGNGMEWLFADEAFAVVRERRVIRFEICDAVKEMATHNINHDATCYFWIYRAMDPTGTVPLAELPAECPGPNIFTTTGDFVVINLTNDLDEPHAFSIPAWDHQRSDRPGRDQRSGSLPRGRAPISTTTT